MLTILTPPGAAGLHIALPADGGAPARELDLALDCGRYHRLVVRNALQRRALVDALESSGMAAVVSSSGRPIANLRVWDNIILPLAYHGTPNTAALEGLAFALFAEFDYSGARAQALAASLPEQIDRFERRLMAFVRALLAEPEVLVLDAVAGNLPPEQREQTLKFGAAFLRRFPFRCVVHLESEPPEPPGSGAAWVAA